MSWRLPGRVEVASDAGARLHPQVGHAAHELAFEPSVGLTVARMRFEGEPRERPIALGGGALRAAPM